MRQLKLGMNPHPENIYGAAIGIEARVGNMLIVCSYPQGAHYVEAVKNIHYMLGTRLDPAISNKSVDTAHVQVLGMLARNPACGKSYSEQISFSPPTGAVA